MSKAVADPRIVLLEDGKPVAANDDWDAAAIGSAFQRSGAFALESGSRDAALVRTVGPGRAYTVHAHSDEAGIALIEVFEIP